MQLGELDTYIDDVLCRCAERSQKLGYEYFGVQNHGEEFYLGVKFITMILVTVNVNLTFNLPVNSDLNNKSNFLVN